MKAVQSFRWDSPLMHVMQQVQDVRRVRGKRQGLSLSVHFGGGTFARRSENSKLL